MKFFDINQFKAIAETLPQLVWACLPDGNCDYLSPQWEEFTGMKMGPQLGLNWLDLVIHPEDRKRVLAHWMGAVEGKHPYDIEYRIRKHDGTYSWFKTRGTPLRDEAGNIAYWFGTCTDIQDTKILQLKFQDIIGNIPAMIWVADANGSCTYTSERWCESTGQLLEEALHHGWLKAFHPDDTKAGWEKFQEAQEKLIPFRYEFRLRQANGTYRWALNTGNPKIDAFGNFLGFIGTVVDIDEQKRSTEILTNFWGLETLLLTVASIHTGKLEKISPAWISLLGYTEEEIISKPWLEFVHPDDVQKTINAGSRLSEGKKVNNFENRYRTKSGKWVWLSWTTYPIGEKIYAWVADITNVKEAHQRAIGYIEAMPQMAFISDPKGNILFYNRRHYQYLGTDSEDSDGWKWRDQNIIHPDDLARTVEVWTESLQTGKTYDHEYRLRRADGEYRWHLARALPIRNEENKIIEWFGTNTEIHDQKLAEEALKKGEEKLKSALLARDEFISLASHELKTPLTSLILKNQVLKRVLNRDVIIPVEKIMANTDDTDRLHARLSRLIDDMLDVSRLETGNFHLQKEDIHLASLASETVANMQSMFTEKHLPLPVLEIKYDSRGQWDRLRVEQIIQNLLTNAIRYGGKEAVTVTVGVDQKIPYVSVRDHGPGISPGSEERIFGRFERSISGNEVSGLGLGLYLSRKLARIHGGDLRVEETPGGGATFILSLPMEHI